MAQQFLGLHMRVVLREPHMYQLTGTVRDVEAGNSLTLTNVFVAGTKEWMPEMRIDARNIADLSEVVSQHTQTTFSAPAVQPVAATAFTPPVPQAPHADPAILSLGRRPTSVTPSGSGSKGRASGSKAAATLPDIQLLGIQDRQGAETNDAPEIAAHELDNDGPVERPGNQQQKTKRRSRPNKQAKPVDSKIENLEEDPTITASGGRGKGWRQTPILQSTSSFQPFKSLKRNGKGGQGADGWASEEVTEEMGDFDFENNLAKFDKRTIFDQMRKDDQIEESDRLVSHNRKAKPGTAGGKNLHYSENVLDLTPSAARNADFWNSEADDGANGAERLSGREAKSGPSGRRGDSKGVASRRSQSRKASGTGSAQATAQPLSRVNSNQGHLPGLYVLPSNSRLEVISTLQMLNLENIAANEIGFTEDLMAENAGRGIAEVSVKALSDPGMRMRFELATPNAPLEASLQASTVAILAGNNKSSVRALAAGRHLRNKNINVVVCLVGVERESDLLEDLRRQMQLYRNFGGKVLKKSDFFEHIRKAATSGSRTSISLIIDALLGLTISFEELRVGDQATVYELMEWANRNEAYVLSVDVPSGIDPSTGKAAIIDGGPLFVKPRYIVAIGAPKKGLLEALTPPRHGEPDALGSGGLDDDDWRLFIADLGLGSAVWRKAGTKIRRGIDFDGRWVLEMEYRPAAVTADG